MRFFIFERPYLMSHHTNRLGKLGSSCLSCRRVERSGIWLARRLGRVRGLIGLVLGAIVTPFLLFLSNCGSHILKYDLYICILRDVRAPGLGALGERCEFLRCFEIKFGPHDGYDFFQRFILIYVKVIYIIFPIFPLFLVGPREILVFIKAADIAKGFRVRY